MNNPENTFKTIKFVAQWHLKQIGHCYPDMAMHLQRLNQFEVNMASVPRFYLIPKVHKTPVVGRPIVASFNWINTEASKTLSTRLRLVITQLQMKRDQGLLPVMPIVSSSYEAKQVLNNWITRNGVAWEENRLPKLNTYSYDFTALYTNLSHELIIHNMNQIMKMMHEIEPQTWIQAEVEAIMHLLQLVLKTTYFKCEELSNQLYRQVIGLPMGTNCAPELANLVLLHYELQHLTRLNRSHCIMVRYIDDIFLIGTRECATAVIDMYNGSGLPLCSAEHNVFLDLSITLHRYYENYAVPLYRLEFDIHQKPLNKYTYTRFNSAAPLSTKKGLVTGELVRYARTVDRFDQFDKVRSKFKCRLMNRGYTARFIERMFNQNNYFTLINQYCKPINWATKITKYHQQLDFGYKPEVPPIWKVLYSNNGINYRQLLSTIASTCHIELPDEALICNVRLPNLKEVLNACRTKFNEWIKHYDPPPTNEQMSKMAEACFDIIVGNHKRRWQRTSFAAQRLIRHLSERGSGTTQIRRQLQLRLRKDSRGRVELTKSTLRPRPNPPKTQQKRKVVQEADEHRSKVQKTLWDSVHWDGSSDKTTAPPKRVRRVAGCVTDRPPKAVKRRKFDSMDYKWY